MYRKTVDITTRKGKAVISGLNSHKKAHARKIQQTDTSYELMQVPLGTFFVRLHGKWHDKGTFCRFCNMPLDGDPILLDKHRYVCSLINTNHSDGDYNMPIQEIKRGGKTYYRYGESGKEYPTRKQAEQQAAAIHAAGYREKKKK